MYYMYMCIAYITYNVMWSFLHYYIYREECFNVNILTCMILVKYVVVGDLLGSV